MDDGQAVLARAVQDIPGVADTSFGDHPYAPGCKRAVVLFENGYLVSIINGWISMGEVEVAVRVVDGDLVWMEDWGDEVRRGWTPDTLYEFLKEVADWKAP